MSKEQVFGNADVSKVESQGLDTIEETGHIVSPSIDPTDPSYTWVSMLTSQEANPFYGSLGKRQGATEKPIGGKTPPEYAAWLIDQCKEQGTPVIVTALVDGKDFKLGNKELSSIVARLRNALLTRKRGQEQKPLLQGEMQFRAIPKGTAMVKQGNQIGHTPAAMVRLSYRPTPEELAG